MNLFGKAKSYAAEAWQKTEHFTSAAWDKTTGLFMHHPSTAVAQVEPQPYGRAGGYVGADRIAVIESSAIAPAANSQNTVKTGESAQGIASDTRVNTSRNDVVEHPQVAPSERQSQDVGTSTVSQSDTQSTLDSSALPNDQRPMDNEAAAASQAPTDLPPQDLAMNSRGDQNAQLPNASIDSDIQKGSGYTGQEQSQADTSASSFEQSSDVGLAGESQGMVETQYVVISPLEIGMMPQAAASEEEATSEFVIIVPANSAGQDQSASSEEQDLPAAD